MHRREHSRISAGWGDAATIIPWTLYQLYGDRQILEDNFEMMRRWVDYMRTYGDEEYLVGGGKIGETTQKLYDILTGIQWGEVEDTFNWVHKL